MKPIIRLYLGVLLLFISYGVSQATHNRAGEITYEQIGDLSIRITIVTYTKTSSHVDRDSLIVYWGDGTSETIARTNGKGTPLDNDIKRNYYIKEHTYPGRGTYTIGMTDPNRIGGILNVNYPNSIRVKFHIATTFTFLNQQFQGENNSAVLLQPPIDVGCVGKPFVHNPNAYDPDGDSLAYEWVVPLQDVGTPVPNFLYPDQIDPGPENNISLDEVTGEIIWDSPQRRGQYNIAIRIKEYRNGILINSIIRDMQIEIQECNNSPPQVQVTDQICAVAGDLIEIPVQVDDPERETQLVRISALGGPLTLEVSPAVFASGEAFEEVPRTVDFIWQTHCEHVRGAGYTMVFKATDNFFSDSAGLVDLKTMNIEVVGPAPGAPDVERQMGQNRITWPDEYNCQGSSNFQGFTIWRRNGSGSIPDDECLPDLVNYGYRIIGFSDKSGRNEFFDTEVQNGVTYCYRITARFASLSSGNNPYNIVESKPSEEACIKIDRDLPLVTKASVITTNPTDGQVDIEWVKPETNVDSMRPDGPYTMTLFHSTSLNGTYTLLPDSRVSAPTIDDFDERYQYTHSDINTSDEQHFYKIEMNSNARSIGFSSIASTIYVSSNQGNNLVFLDWNSITPWNNFNYTVYRKEAGTFVERAETNRDQFADRDVQNGVEYCYKIEGAGNFLGISLQDTTINFSQEICVVPDDRTPPCKPELEVQNNCEDARDDQQLFTNTLQYTLPDTCLDLIEDLEVRLWYRAYGLDSFVDITADPTVFIVNENTANHSSSSGFAGCYRVQMIDQFGNEGLFSDTICVDPCPAYKLPNVFTPNNDGRNDLIYPLQRAFIQRVNFEAYNRWGNLVFQTNDADINWDGSALNGEELEPGTYTYKCDLFLNTEQGEILFNTISGTIDLIK
ncbi:gliding motility-associated C-terminal domain-containing protein [Membranicola marinus]|uniref:Gliding motility-associated C-terminal domain-containing protein n=1 Tax=Membranihabitans marinus TaxID=1227546 RepID=A0A953L974_9BACT|nr:gliding motility-associated C-terminal domain-containing protein [Membranihabitans marinus]MBY5957328.1 gliding motility-associated C-terminal domain-containing protein [Membranihabitans marinus]